MDRAGRHQTIPWTTCGRRPAMSRRVISILVVVAALSAAGTRLSLSDTRPATADQPAVPIGPDRSASPTRTASRSIPPASTVSPMRCSSASPIVPMPARPPCPRWRRSRLRSVHSAKGLTTLFVRSIQERDTPSVLKEYISDFGGNTVAFVRHARSRWPKVAKRLSRLLQEGPDLGWRLYDGPRSRALPDGPRRARVRRT